MISLETSFRSYLESIALARSPNTARTYRNALSAFQSTLLRLTIDPAQTSARATREAWLAEFTSDLKALAPATERLYITAVSGWYEYLAAESLARVNLPKLKLLIRRRARRPGVRLPQFPQADIERVLEYAESLVSTPAQDAAANLRRLRDRAFLTTLADTGLRVHEACGLKRGDVDWEEGQALLIGKGDRQAVVRFSRRSLACLQQYLRARAALDGASGRPLSSLAVFARHDPGTGTKVRRITTTTGRNIVRQRVAEALGAEAEGLITPHSFRHFFVTSVLRGSGGNLKLAQELARHRNIAVTQRYAHLSDSELDRAYEEIFNAQAGSSPSGG
jgi:site-specific recombinase XerD